MVKSPSTWLFILLSLFFFLVHADTIETIPGTYDTLVGDSEDVFSPTPGSAVYSADTGNLLLTTSLDARDMNVMEEIGGIGNYIVIRTQQAQWCTGLEIEECRKNSGFLDEAAFSIQFIQQIPPVDEIIPDENIFDFEISSMRENEVSSEEIVSAPDNSSIPLLLEESNPVSTELGNDDTLGENPDVAASDETSFQIDDPEEVDLSSPQYDSTDTVSVPDETTVLTESSDISVVHE